MNNVFTNDVCQPPYFGDVPVDFHAVYVGFLCVLWGESTVKHQKFVAC